MKKLIILLSLSIAWAMPVYGQSTATQVVIGSQVVSNGQIKFVPTGIASNPVWSALACASGSATNSVLTCTTPGSQATFQPGGGGGSGTVNIGSTGQIAAYLSNGTAVSPTNNIDLNNGGVTIGTGAVGNAPGLNGAYVQGAVSIGAPAHASLLNVDGNASIGVDYVIVAAPTNGAIIEGNVGIGTTFPTQLLGIGTTNQFTVSSSGAVVGASFSGLGTGLTGTAAGLTAGTVTTNANLTGPITSSGNATSIASQTGTGSTFVVNTAPTIQTSLNITPASGGLLLGGANGISYPSVDSTVDGTIAIGSQALANIGTTSAAFNSVAIGEQALSGTLTTGATENVAIGFQAGRGITSVNQNIAIGWQAQLTGNGGANTVIGASANGSGHGETIVGATSISSGNNSTVIGEASFCDDFGACLGTGTGKSGMSGGTSAIVGGQAGTAITSGASNSIIGFQTGDTVTTGSRNVIIGDHVGSTTLTTGSNNILIGTNSGVDVQTAASTGTLNIGNVIYGTGLGTSGTTSAGFIGIGTATPVTGAILTLAGHIGYAPTNVPTVTTCGSGTLVTGSTDNKGQITGITAATACTITFSSALPAGPSCSFSTSTGIAAGGIPTTAAVTSAMALFTGTLGYICQ